MSHVADAFFAAVRTLAGDAPLKQRLAAAYVDHLAEVDTDALPEAIRTRFELLRQALTSASATEKETAVEVSVRKMSPPDAARYTRSIVAMFAELVRVKATGEPLAASEGIRYASGRRFTSRALPDNVQLPAFLARGEATHQ
jgi:hypothetical protein